MDNKKFEQLIELIINENEEQARALFHDIVVEKSREIYESMMDEEMDEGMGGQVGDLMDEINAEEAGGMTEEEESDEDVEDIEMDDEVEMDADDSEDMGGEEDLEDRVVDLEDKLDQLMAEFESIMGDEEGEEMDMDMEAGDEEGEEMDMDMDMEAGDEEEVMEAVQLQKVSVTHGDNGVQTKSPGLQNSGQAGMDSKPVKFAGDAEADPKGPKGPTNAYAKGETQVKGAGQFKNAPGHKSQDLASAPKPKHGDDGANTKSPVAESRKVTKKIVK
jgi:hypothetical protein